MRPTAKKEVYGEEEEHDGCRGRREKGIDGEVSVDERDDENKGRRRR